MAISEKLTIAALFRSLREHLLVARDHKNRDELEKLFAAFILIGDAAIEMEDEVVIDLSERL